MIEMFSKNDIQDICLLTPMQQSMIYHEKRAESADAQVYFQQIHCSMEGKLSISHFKQAVDYMVDKYDILRTAFLDKGISKPVQVILKKRKIDVMFEDLSKQNVDNEACLENYKLLDKERGFDLLNDPLVRVAIFQEDFDCFSIIFSFHHIILDGWSLSNLLVELKRVYSELTLTNQVTYKNVEPFTKFLAWQEKQSVERALDFWNSYLEGEQKKASLFTRNRTLSAKKGNFQRIVHVIAKDKIKKINAIANQYGLTLASMFNTMWGIVLQKYNRTDDVVFASVISGRNADVDGIEDIVGMLINSIPVRVKVSPKTTLKELLQLVNEESLLSTEHSHISLSEIQALTALKNNLIDNVVVFENYPFDTDMLKSTDERFNFNVRKFEVNGHSNYDFSLTIYAGENVKLSANVNLELFDAAYIENVLDSFELVVDAIVENLNTYVSDVNLLSGKQRDMVLQYSFSNLLKDESDENSTFEEIFNQIVVNNYDQPAVVYHNHLITYEELDKRTNQLARRIIDSGCKPGDIIGIYADRSVEMIVAIVAIIKAGGVYLPLNQYYPHKVLQNILMENNVQLILKYSRQKEDNKVFNIDIKIMDIDLKNDEIYSGDSDLVPTENSSISLLYLLYTSGTTGKPKGVGVEHNQLVNTIRGLEKEIYSYYKSPLRVGLVAPSFFDGSIKQIFASLLLGHTLYIVDEETRFNGQKLLDYIISEQIDIIDATPAHLNMMSASYKIGKKEKLEKLNLKCILVGGEKLTIENARDFLSKYNQNNVELINVYGLTECTVDTTTFRITQEKIDRLKQIPIGKPLYKQSVLILDNEQKLVPIGMEGEIHIGGNSVARGYIRDSNLQEERYVTIPGFEPEIFYKTGDLGQWDHEGNILYRGRADLQVKIRGYRIELMEIELAIQEYPSIRDVVVLDVERNDAEYLSAFYVSDEIIDVYEIRNYLIDKLPQYMVPSFYTQIEEIPLKDNGKVDTNKLRQLSEMDYSFDDYQAPRNQTEAKLANVWKNILQLDKVSNRDNFFSMGGHSLKAMEIIMQIGKEFRVDVPFKYFFEHPTILGLSEYILRSTKNKYREMTLIEKKEFYNISAQQKRMYTFFKYDPKSIVYNIISEYKLEGELDFKRLQSSLNRLVDRHEILRTIYDEVDGQVVQRVLDQTTIPIQYVQMELSNKSSHAEKIKQVIRPFDLNKEIPLDIYLIETSPNEYLLLLNMHHISFDGMSVSIFLDELFNLYFDKNLPPLSLHYKDYAEWQKENNLGEFRNDQEKYWLDTLQGDLPKLNVPLDYIRPSVRDYSGNYIDFELDKETHQMLKDVSIQTEATLYTVLYSLFHLVLYKYTGQKDMITGTITSGRFHADIRSSIGMFVNTCAIRTKIDEDYDLGTFIRSQRDTILEMFEYQDYPFEDLLELLDIQVERNRNPLFDVLFSMNNYEEFELRNLKGNLLLEPIETDLQVSKFDFALIGTEKKDHLSFRLEYNDQLFKRESIFRFIIHFTKLAKDTTEILQKKLPQINLIAHQEKDKVLHEFNNTTSGYPREKTVKDLFEEQCLLQPYKTALVYNGEDICYKKLNEKANQIARYLIKEGVGNEAVIGISMEQGFDRIAAILGIIKAGAAFLPIDETYPKERIEYMLRDSKAKLLVTDYGLQRNIEFLGKVVSIHLEDIKNQDTANLSTQLSPNNLVYIMYTSGSTGQPKGVMVEHKNVVRLVKETNYINFQETDRIIQGSTIVFDASTLEIWGALLNGLELHLVEKETMLNPDRLRNVIEKNKITIMWMTAPLFNQMSRGNPDIFHNMRYLLVGGDALLPEPIERVRQACGGVTILNGYGPTENTTFSTIHHIDRKYTNNIPIGKPIANSTVYIIDSHMNLQPIGAIGEIYVGGDGVSRGYLNNAALTKEKFIDNPFRQGERLYRTGDMGRWLPDGSIEYLGRVDQQVKIRGFRIELGEIVNTMLSHPFVKEATALIKEKGENVKYITAYVVMNHHQKKDNIRVLREYVKTKLPEYMHPVFILEVQEIPLTLNGKVNREALLSIPEETFIETLEEPTNVIEEKLVTIWLEAFNRNKIGINQDFFSIGGNSLLAIELLAKLNHAFSVDLTIRELFIQSTIKNIAIYIQNSQISHLPSVQKSVEKDYYTVTLAQEKLYALSMVDEQNVAYNMPTVFLLKGIVDIDALKGSFERLIDRHEAFRTSFHIVDNQIVQYISNEIQIDFDYMTLGNHKLDVVLQESIRPFSLSAAPLVRIRIIEVDKMEYALFIDMHHIISDGVSLNHFINELFTLYAGNGISQFEPIEIHHKDFVEWQKTLYEQQKMNENENYWLQSMKELPEFQLPYDYLKTNQISFEGTTVECELRKGSGRKIQELAMSFGCTPYVVLLSIFNIVLSKYTKQIDVVIGTAINGRKFKELHNTIGMFTQTVPLKASVEADKTVKQLMNEVKDRVFTAIDHQEYEAEKLLELLDVFPNKSKNLFDVVFTFETKGNLLKNVNGLTIQEHSLSFNYTKFDLVFSVTDRDGEYTLELQYNTKLFKQSTVERIATYFRNVFEHIETYKNIGEIELITSDERNKLLHEFNLTTVNYPTEKSIVEHFAQVVRQYPNKNAILCKDKKLTYKQLDERATNLAIELIENGVKRSDLVAIVMESELDLIVAMLGSLKAGAAFLPIDPKYPTKRIKYILNDSQSKILITKQAFTDVEYSTPTLLIEELELDQKVRDHTLPRIQKTDLAYVIYTSGTTGNPKGVMVEHHSLVNLCFWHNEEFMVSEEDHASKYAGVGFDATIWEIFPYLIKGASLYMIKEQEKLNMHEINEFFEKNHITISFLPTPIGEQFIKLENHSLRLLLLGGDRLKEFIPKPYRIVNNYGPTENTVVTTSYLVEQNETNIPIGKPISNTKVYILDANQKLQPIGVPGELCISGESLARGYVNNPQLTSEKFVENPFNRKERMYKTGDIVKWNEDGTITFLGRNDNQTKIRGNRVEISEIEAALLRNKEIESVVVIATEEEQRSRVLVAYITTRNEIDVKTLRKDLKSELPHFMVPSHFIVMDEILLTVNGKVDLNKLPKVRSHENHWAQSRPKTELERQIYELWRTVLKIDDFGIDADFFELGGDSLKAVYLLGDIREKLNLESTVSEIYENSTVESYAMLLEPKKHFIHEIEMYADDVENIDGVYPLGSSQKRIFILDYFNESSTLYNMPSIYKVKGRLEVEQVEKAMKQLIVRHESLRASFYIEDNEFVQIINDQIEYQVENIVLNGENEKSVISSLIKPFDLRKAPLLRTAVVEIQKDEYLLFFDMHHIICDGVSMEILLQEFFDLYQGKLLPNLNRSYTEFITWQHQYYKSDSLIRQRRFWEEKLAGYHNYDVVPIDFPRDTNENVDSNVIGFSLSQEVHERLVALTKEFRCTPSVLLTAVYGVLLHKYSNRNDIIIGCVTAGRQHPNVKQIVGMFTNTLPIRYFIDSEKGFVDFLHSANQNMVNAFDNQDYQFEDMIDHLKIKRVVGKVPLIDTLFQFQNLQLNNASQSNLQIESYDIDVKSSKFDLEIYVQQTGQTIEFSINYRNSLFKEESISNLIKDYKRLVEIIIENPYKKIKNIDILSTKEWTKNMKDIFETVTFDIK